MQHLARMIYLHIYYIYSILWKNHIFKKSIEYYKQCYESQTYTNQQVANHIKTQKPG